MLPKERRLTRKRDFTAVYTGGKAYTHRLVVLRVLGRRGGQVTRFGFSASAKLGKAVARNRARRLLRESVRSLVGGLRESGFDAILIARPAARTANLADIREAVGELFHRAGLMQGAAEANRAQCGE